MKRFVTRNEQTLAARRRTRLEAGGDAGELTETRSARGLTTYRRLTSSSTTLATGHCSRTA
jgi:hypothetical protein